MISGKSKVFGVIGSPIAHTMSPMMQNLYLERTGVDGVYAAFHVEEEHLGEMVAGAAAMHLAGINVTVPHKQQVMKYLSDVDESAKAIGAVNTLVPVEGGYKGFNTDAVGLSRAISEAGMSVKDKSCVVLGAGGAAKAVVYLLLKEGAKNIYLLNRNQEKAVSLAAYMNDLMETDRVIPMALGDYRNLPEDRYFAVQCTSAGMYPNVDQAPIEDETFYQKIHMAVDIVYTPAETKFMRYVKAAGGQVINGLDMLIYQGIASFQLWNPQVTVDKETIDMARQMMKKQLEGNDRT